MVPLAAPSYLARGACPPTLTLACTAEVADRPLTLGRKPNPKRLRGMTSNFTGWLDERLRGWQLRSKCAMVTLMDELGVALDEAPSQTAFDAISGRLATLTASEDAHRLWAEVRKEFETGGPAAVKALIDSRVRALQRTAQKDLKETRSVARTTVPERKKKPAKAKPRTRRT